MRIDWTLDEVEALVADYFGMLECQLRNQGINKAERIRQLQLKVARTDKSIQYKYRNVSAVLCALEHPWVSGYVPAGHRQQLLYDVVAARISGGDSTTELIRDMVQSALVPVDLPEVPLIEVKPPTRSDRQSVLKVSEPLRRSWISQNIDFIAQEARNRTVGEAGERFILEFEARRLHRAGARHLVDRVEHVAQTQGDGLGYDILSFESDGQERLIEVKTTRFHKLTPFYVTQNELAVSTERPEAYHLCRVFDFCESPRLFTLHGRLDRVVHLSPVSYRAVF